MPTEYIDPRKLADVVSEKNIRASHVSQAADDAKTQRDWIVEISRMASGLAASGDHPHGLGPDDAFRERLSRLAAATLAAIESRDRVVGYRKEAGPELARRGSGI